MVFCTRAVVTRWTFVPESRIYDCSLESASLRIFWEPSAPSSASRHDTACEHHVITDARGIPSAVLTGGNRHDVTQLPPPQAVTP